jgi:hypothetical protein
MGSLDMLYITGLFHWVRVMAHGLLFVAALAIFMSTSAMAASSVTLAWDSTTNNIAGYKIYYGEASHTYTHTNTVANSNATGVTISNLVIGTTYYFAATAYDSSNLESDYSNEAIYTNVVLAPPTIVLSLPTNGATFTAPATFNLVSRVTANGHAISSVQFYNGSTLLGEDTNAPYVFRWSSVAEGTYSLTARLIYDAGATLDSTPAVNVLVAAPRPPNTPPTITTIADQTTSQDTATPPISFTIGDAETAASNLTVYAASADPALVPTNNIVFGGSDSNLTVTLTPVAGVTGTVDITVFVSDGNLTTNTTFQLAVQPASPTPALTLATEGSGTISSGLDAQSITPGQVYTVTAVPEEGQEFAGWTGSISSSDARLTFVMNSNLVLNANFRPKRTGSAGHPGTSYNGLFFQTNAVSLTSAGSFTLSLTSRGRYSGRILLGAHRYSFSGLLDTTQGSGTNVIKRAGGPALNLDFQVGGDQADQISGHLTDGTWTALLSGDRAVFCRTNPAPFAGNYTLVVPGYDTNSALPAGDSFGSLKVNSAGQVTFVGTLADGTKVSQSTSISRAGYWPLHIPLYTGNGLLMSWLTFASPTNDLSGNLTWIKQSGSGSKYYLAGFTCQSDIFGSKYVRTDPILNLPTATLTFSGGSLDSCITNSIMIGAHGKVTTPGKQLRLSFSATTGTFAGTFLDPATGKPHAFSGAVFQKLNTAYGVYFGTGDQTSEVTLAP